MRTKGYLMIEMMLVMVIMLSVSILCLPKYHSFNYDDYYFGNEYNLAKSEALKTCESTPVLNLRKLNVMFPIYFSENGNVNKAQTIKGKRYQMVVHLGNGYLSYEN